MKTSVKFKEDVPLSLRIAGDETESAKFNDVIKGDKGEKGESGNDGFSPLVSISKNGKVSTITITDSNGSHSTTIHDGNDGAKGEKGQDGKTPVKGVDYFDGAKGQDGYTPIKGVDYTDGYTPVKGVDYNDGYTPIKGVDYFDGAKGETGNDGYTPRKGIDYFDGAKGEKGDDGVSPVLTTSKNGKVTTVTVTDASGTHSFEINDGADGTGAVVSVNGKSGTVVLDASDVNALSSDTEIPDDDHINGLIDARRFEFIDLDSIVETETGYSGTSLYTSAEMLEKIQGGYIPILGLYSFNVLGTYDESYILLYANQNSVSYFMTAKVNSNKSVELAYSNILAEIESETLAEYIPSDDHINELIDAKLGVIENGTY